MFKLFFIYPLVLFVVVWLSSDVKVGASLYSFDDNYISIEFPKTTFRSDENAEPWFTFYWNGDAAHRGIKNINDAVVK